MSLFSAIRNLFWKPKEFKPDFPIIPLLASEDDARMLLSQLSQVSEDDPESDRTIAQKLLVAESADTRIAVGIWNGRVRFANYLTQQFNESDELRVLKLAWFVEHYGGVAEFEDPNNTGYMIFWRNPSRKILLIYGLHMGPVRVIDQNPEHWSEE